MRGRAALQGAVATARQRQGLGQHQAPRGASGLQAARPPKSAQPPHPRAGAPRPGGPTQPQGPPPTPWDSIASLEDAGATRKANDTTADLASDRDLKERYYGLGSGYDNPASNPWSQAALLKAQSERARAGTLNSAGNASYSGSTLNHLGAVDRQTAIALNDLKERREGDLAAIDRQGQDNAQELDEGRTQAQIGAVERFEEQPLEPAPAGKKTLKKKPQPAARRARRMKGNR